MGRFTLVLVLTCASLLGVSLANKDWGFGFNNTNWPGSHQRHNQTHAPKKIIVGGSQNWHFGFNYTDWSLKNAPFYSNDTLVFKYDPPSNNTFPHSVYLLPNLRSFLNCDLKRAKMIANPTQGDGKGFEFVLKKHKPHYFACGERNGFHCKVGLMKFAVVPLRWRY
ncbi:Plastocyanin-like protein [Corchorus olitorius]|uniref:Plastocyanin-like protein n=1 Tax=Corchorus olitorius TaxID=93759 RepID=A0A1R3GYI9_9ROSI|nr:Plastocyanin-like protein [Corchorus olitorius]